MVKLCKTEEVVKIKSQVTKRNIRLQGRAQEVRFLDLNMKIPELDDKKATPCKGFLSFRFVFLKIFINCGISFANLEIVKIF